MQMNLTFNQPTRWNVTNTSVRPMEIDYGLSLCWVVQMMLDNKVTLKFFSFLVESEVVLGQTT